MEKEKKPIFKKWWFWLIFAIILITIILVVGKVREERELDKTMQTIGNSASDYMKGIDNAKSHLDEFSYNNATGKVDYKPKITLEAYNKIKEGMTQEEIVEILGEQENRLEGENTYILEWGDSYKPVTGGYWIQIVFDNKTNKVTNMSQVGLQNQK